MSENYGPNSPNISIYPQKYTIASPNTTIPGNQYQYDWNMAPDPWAAMPQIDGLDELCEMLGISEGGQPPLLTGVSGVRYSLVNVLRAQMELMVRLNILLVHRRLVPDE